MGQGSSWKPKLCWGEGVRRPPQCHPGPCREGILEALRPGRELGGLCLADSGAPLGVMEQAKTFLCCSVHFVSTPLFSQGCSLCFSKDNKPFSLLFSPFCPIPAHPSHMSILCSWFPLSTIPACSPCPALSGFPPPSLAPDLLAPLGEGLWARQDLTGLA